VPEGFEVVELDHPSDRRLLPTFDQAVQSLS
jgi:hypothetical protein